MKKAVVVSLSMITLFAVILGTVAQCRALDLPPMAPQFENCSQYLGEPGLFGECQEGNRKAFMQYVEALQGEIEKLQDRVSDLELTLEAIQARPQHVKKTR